MVPTSTARNINPPLPRSQTRMAAHTGAQFRGTGKLEKLVASISERNKLVKQLGTTKATIAVLQTLCKIDKLLTAFEDELEQGRIVKAAESVSEAQTLMQSLAPGTEAGCDAKIFSAIREDLFRKLAHVKEKLDDMWRKAVVWHYGAKAGE